MLILPVYIFAAVFAYLIGGINPSIIVSKAIYKKDVRELGSNNAGFTNFKRVFGGKWAWLVLIGDILKAVLTCFIIGQIFEHMMGRAQFGAAYACFFAILGHTFPIWYGFRGGKGVAVICGGYLFINWFIWLVCFPFFVLVLILTKYMSVAVICGSVASVILLALSGADKGAVVMVSLCVALIAWQHRENFKRLRSGTESKFSFRSRLQK